LKKQEEIANYSYYIIREFNLNETLKTFDFEYKDTAANEYKRLKFKTKEVYIFHLSVAFS